MPNIAFKRPELVRMLALYFLIRDCIEGERKIKEAKTKYLPMPNPEDDSKENKARYNSYLERAVFYNVTQRTLGGLIGQVFLREPVIELPAQLDVVKEDATGSGVSLVQLAKRATAFVVALGRSGILADYPDVEGPASQEDIDNGNIRPVLSVYDPSKILNWRTITVGAKILLSLIVLEEEYIKSDDGFEIKKDTQWRVLQLDAEGDYVVTVWRKNSANFEIAMGPFFPKDASGNYLREIPFSFIGATNNDSEPDAPPLYDLASINVAHYRNSADYEEACFITGQPTLVTVGLTEEWYNNVLKGNIGLGSRGGIPLPVNAGAELLQAAPNTMPFEAMEHKERQMVALGAKLVEQSTVQRTATEATIENASETSTLATAAKNVSAAFKFALTHCADFVGVDPATIDFQLHTDFDIANLNPEERKQLVSEWQQGAIAFEEMRENLRRAGIAKLDDTEAKEKIGKEMKTALNLEMKSENKPPSVGK